MKRATKFNFSKENYPERVPANSVKTENMNKLKPKKTKEADLENKKSTLFLIGMVLALSLTLFAFEWKQPVKKTVIIQGSADFEPPEDLVIPRTKDERAEAEKPIIKVPVFKVIKDNIKIDDELEWIGEEPEDPVFIDFGSIISPEKDKDEIDIDKIFDTVEIMPKFPGGEAALLSYLSRNVKYPLIAQENGIQGRVYVTFVIDENGEISDAVLARSIDSSLDREALRVVKSMPRWKPGKQGNREVKVRYTVPINFVLQ